MENKTNYAKPYLKPGKFRRRTKLITHGDHNALGRFRHYCRFSEPKGLRFTGLIGLLVAAVKTRRLEKGEVVNVLNKLARSDFRISSDLLLWAEEEIGRLTCNLRT